MDATTGLHINLIDGVSASCGTDRHLALDEDRGNIGRGGHSGSWQAILHGPASLGIIDLVEILHAGSNPGVFARSNPLGHGNGQQDSDDQNHDHDLDQREALSSHYRTYSIVSGIQRRILIRISQKAGLRLSPVVHPLGNLVDIVLWHGSASRHRPGPHRIDQDTPGRIAGPNGI